MFNINQVWINCIDHTSITTHLQHLQYQHNHLQLCPQSPPCRITYERWERGRMKSFLVILNEEMTIVYLMINFANNLAFNLSDLPFQYIKT